MALPTTLKATATAAKTGSTCTADIGGIETVVEVARDLSVSAGDGLLVTRSGNTWYAIARVGTAAPASVGTDEAPPPPKPKPDVQSGRLVVSPNGMGSYRSGQYRDDTGHIIQGNYGGWGNNIGAVFYGNKPRSLSGATVTSARVRIRRLSQGGAAAKQALTLRLVTERFRTTSSPTLTSSTAGPSLAWGQTVDSYAIPNSWAQAMVDGTAGGLAIFVSGGSPYVLTAGKSDWGPAWTLTISWTR